MADGQKNLQFFFEPLGPHMTAPLFLVKAYFRKLP